jgi:hypothetical protein
VEGAADRELIRLDYEQTVVLVRALNEVRFKLLAFVPTIAGASVAFLSSKASRAELLAVGLLGLVATLGVFVYDLRNNQHYMRASVRAQELERRLGFPNIDGAVGGLNAAPPTAATNQLLALGLVYGAALGGWVYIVAWALAALLDLPSPKTIGAVIGIASGIAVLAAIVRIEDVSFKR